MSEVRRVDRLRAILTRRKIRRRWDAITALVVVLIAVAVPFFTVKPGLRWWQAQRAKAREATKEETREPAIVFPDRRGEPLIIHTDRWSEIGLKLAEVKQAPPPPPLKLDGVLYLDPDDYSLVRSRFQGEVVEMPHVHATPDNPADGTTADHSLRFGDDVKKGQLLCVIWSRELGEKKSELAESLSTLAFDRETLQRLKSNEAAVPLSSIREAERRERQDELEVERIEKTLRSWQLSSEEIERIRNELLPEKSGKPRGSIDLPKTSVDSWARVEIRSPIDGTIVEKNITVGTLVSLDDALFKIANLNHLDVRAFAYEEDLATLQRLPPEQRKWTIQLKGDTESKPIEGVFDRIGSLIDPLQHTGLVMGWVDNPDRTLRAGQFVTAMVPMPETRSLVSVPAKAVVDMDAENYVLLQRSQPDTFIPQRVQVVRFQEEVACIDPSQMEDRLQQGDHVVSSGAVEILAEYQIHMKTAAPPPGGIPASTSAKEPEKAKPAENRVADAETRQ